MVLSYVEYQETIKDNKVMDRPSFSRHIMSLAAERGEGIIETITQYCEEQFMDVTEVVPNIDQTLREAIRAEAISTKRIKSSTKTFC